MEPQWDRLGDAVRHRRTSQGWTQDEVFDRGGPSDTLQSDIEGKRWRPTRSVKGTLQKIDTGMRWAPGSASNLLAGGDPTPLEGAAAAVEQSAPVWSPPPSLLAEPEPDPVAVIEDVVSDNWAAAEELVDAVLRSSPSDELIEATNRAVFLISGCLIIRILNSGHQTELEPLLARIYSEREALYRRLQHDQRTLRRHWVTATNEGNNNDVETASEPDASTESHEGEEAESDGDEEVDPARSGAESPPQPGRRDATQIRDRIPRPANIRQGGKHTPRLDS